MRAIPTSITVATGTNSYIFYMAGSVNQFNSITYNSSDTRSAEFYATTSGATAGQAGFFAIGGSGGNLKFSAEL
jgi:hypothetical protein